MLILKSASPRRKQIFEDLKLEFEVLPAKIDEDTYKEEIPLDYLKRVTISKLEIEKAQKGNIYVSSDTIVVLNGEILGKPADFNEAVKTISRLSGKIHSVYSGLALWEKDGVFYDFEETKVQFRELSDLEIKTYIESAKPFDKAGAYGIQDVGTPVANFIGSYSNVMGFPIRKFFKYFDVWKKYMDPKKLS